MIRLKIIVNILFVFSLNNLVTKNKSNEKKIEKTTKYNNPILRKLPVIIILETISKKSS